MIKKLLLNRETLQTKLLEATPEDFHLLDRAYRNIYRPAFPKADHRERLADMKKYIETNSPQQEYQVVITQHTSSAGYQRPISIAAANCLSDPDLTIAFFEYAAVHPSYQGQGLWGSITKARTGFAEEKAEGLGTKLAAIFTETEKSHLFSGIRFSDDPEDRYYRVDFKYIQLPVREDAQSVHNLALLARFNPESREQYLTEGLPGEVMLHFLHLYFNSFQVRYDYREHPDFLQMKEEIEKESVRLKEL
jgi:GNAT superfamily N-acetyltransferase